jgi:hypothetical protein
VNWFRLSVAARVSHIKRAFFLGFEHEITRIRWFFYVKIRRQFRQYISSDETNVGGAEYSKSHFYSYHPYRRFMFPLYLLKSIPNQDFSPVLVIGPRYENEYFVLRGFDYKHNEIFMLDTFSYSKLIGIGDMHSMTYQKAFFKAIVCSWTLSYSNNPKLACVEMDRVLAPGGIVIIAVDKISGETEALSRSVMTVPTGRHRVQSINQIKDLFPGYSVITCIEPKAEGTFLCCVQKPI